MLHHMTTPYKMSCWRCSGAAVRCNSTAAQGQRDEGDAYSALVVVGPKWNLPRPCGRREYHHHHAPRADSAHGTNERPREINRQARRAHSSRLSSRPSGLHSARVGDRARGRRPVRSGGRAAKTLATSASSRFKLKRGAEWGKRQRDGRATRPHETAAHLAIEARHLRGRAAAATLSRAAARALPPR